MTPVLLLTGYLGAGKTTLLNRILTNEKGIRFAVIVNDIGEVNIDAQLIQKGGIVGQEQNSDDLVALQNGCICCSLRTDLIKQLMDIVDTGKFDYIVIEASGICEPAPIAQTIEAIPSMVQPGQNTPVLDCIVTVVDALRLHDEFENGNALRNPGIEEEDLESLVIQQIEFCNIILLNKISEVSKDDARELHEIIRAIQPKAKIIDCDYADVDLANLINTHAFDFEKVATSATWVEGIESAAPDMNPAEEHNHDYGHEHHHHDHEHHHHDDHHAHGHNHEHHHHDCEGHTEEYGVSSFVYFNRRPFDFNKFDRFLAQHWPKSIIRAKGVLYFSHNRDMSILFEQAGRQMSIKEAGFWYATASEEELKTLLASDPSLLRDWHPEYGDRMDKIVFIGKNMDKDAIIASLDECLA